MATGMGLNMRLGSTRQPLWCHRSAWARTGAGRRGQPEFTAGARRQRVRPPRKVMPPALIVPPLQECQRTAPMQLRLLQDVTVDHGLGIHRPYKRAARAPRLPAGQPCGMAGCAYRERPGQQAWHCTPEDGNAAKQSDQAHHRDDATRWTPVKAARCGCVGRVNRVRHRAQPHGRGTSARAYRLRYPEAVGILRARLRKIASTDHRASARATGRARACRAGSASAGA